MSKKKGIAVPTVESGIPDTIIPTPVVDGYVEQKVEVEPQVVETPPIVPIVEESPVVTVEEVVPEILPEQPPVVAEPELPEQVQPETVVETPKDEPVIIAEFDNTKIVVDRFLFYKMMSTCVKGSGFVGFAALARFSAILGVEGLENQKAEWKKIQAYLREAKENGESR